MPTQAAPNTDTRVARREGLDLVKHELELRVDDIRKVLPPSMNVDRFTRVSLIAIAKNPDLLKCTPKSLITSIIEAAEVGLEPTGSLNRAWLVPFRKNQQSPQEAQLMIGYQGYADLMRLGDDRRRVVMEVVYEGDHFKVVKGTETPRIEHEPAYLTEDPTKITHAYAILFYPDGTNQFEVMTRSQIELVRAKSRQRNGPAWTEGYAQMCRKSAGRRLSNYVPLTAEAAAAIARDDEREFGQPAEPMPSRTAEVRSAVTERIRSRGQATAAAEAPQDENTTDGDFTPVDSATEQTNAAVCGASSDPKLGDVETCVLEAGHKGKDEKPSPHKGKSGAVWPNTAEAPQ